MNLMIEDKKFSAEELQRKIYYEKVGILGKICCCRIIRRKFFVTWSEQREKESHLSVIFKEYVTFLLLGFDRFVDLFDLYTDIKLAILLY